MDNPYSTSSQYNLNNCLFNTKCYIIISTIFQIISSYQLPYTYTRDVPINELREEYDFIVVGAGPGGATVTNRLTEIQDWNVLLIEAGGEENLFTDVPVMASLFQATDYNWGYRAQPQDNACLGLKDKRSVWPRGKGMGGSSIINFMIYTRGHAEDYNNWERLGNTGWGWNNVLEYFKKSERANDRIGRNNKYHSRKGYLNVGEVPHQSKMVDAFVKSGIELGYKEIDYNAGELIGFSKLQATLDNGARCSANKAFLRPIRNRKNLHVIKNALVTKLYINNETKQTVGVEFYKNGKIYYKRVSKEIILSAGVINTPQLLMLSGIGPRDELDKFQIPIISELPGVGQNLQDHITMPLLSFFVNESISILNRRLLFSIKPVLEYLALGKGILTVPGGTEGLGYIHTNISRESKIGYPDIELIFGGAHSGSDDGVLGQRVLGLSDNVYNTVVKPTYGEDGFALWPLLMRPTSKGWVKLKSKNPFIWPLMYGNYLSDEHEVDTIVEGIKFIINLIKGKPFQRIGTVLNTIKIPGCEHLEFNTDIYWKCTVRYATFSLYHQCCTAKMGPATDPMSVVDPELRVYGVNGLRIVDASIMPHIPAAHLYAPTIMIGEKAADLIKIYYNRI